MPSSKKDRAATPSSVEWVRVGDTHIGAGYQRKVDQRLVDKIAANFDPWLLAIPSVVRRADGTLWVTDGQHRILALRKMGWDDQKIQCEVQNEVSYERSALTHVERNDLRRATSPFDKFMGRIEAKQPMQMAILKIVQDLGMDIRGASSKSQDNSHGADLGAITAVSSLEKLYQDGGADHLKTVLGILIDAWGPVHDAVQAPIMKAVGKLVSEYDRLVDRDRLIRSLKRYRPAEYIKRGYAGKELNRSNVANNIVVALVADYNNLPGGRKLPHAAELVGQGHRGQGGRRLTVAQRGQVVELVSNGYSNTEIKARYPKVTTKLLANLRREMKPARKRKAVKSKAR